MKGYIINRGSPHRHRAYNIVGIQLTWYDKGIGVLSCWGYPNKANVANFHDNSKILRHNREATQTACFSTISLLSIILCQKHVQKSNFRKEYWNRLMGWVYPLTLGVGVGGCFNGMAACMLVNTHVGSSQEPMDSAKNPWDFARWGSCGKCCHLQS